jgi:hypothetical protein
MFASMAAVHGIGAFLFGRLSATALPAFEACSTALIPVALAAIAKRGLPFDPVNAR